MNTTNETKDQIETPIDPREDVVDYLEGNDELYFKDTKIHVHDLFSYIMTGGTIDDFVFAFADKDTDRAARLKAKAIRVLEIADERFGKGMRTVEEIRNAERLKEQ